MEEKEVKNHGLNKVPRIKIINLTLENADITAEELLEIVKGRFEPPQYTIKGVPVSNDEEELESVNHIKSL